MTAQLLLLDENILVQRVVELAFRGKGIDVQITENADEALEIAENMRPDVVVASLDIEGSAGLNFCRRLREQPDLSQTPLLVLTSTRNRVRDEEIQEVGAMANIEKPFKPVVFTQEVERIIGPGHSASTPRPESPDEEEGQPPSPQAPPALDNETRAPVIEQQLEGVAEKIAARLLQRIEDTVVKQLPDIIEQIVIREIEKIKRGE